VLVCQEVKGENLIICGFHGITETSKGDFYEADEFFFGRAD